MHLKFVFFTVFFLPLSGNQKQPHRVVQGCCLICSKFTGEQRCQSLISIKFFCNFIEITLQHGYSTVNLLHIFRTPFLKNTPGQLLLQKCKLYFVKLYLKDCNTRNKDSEMLTYAQVVSFHYVAFFDLRVGQRKVYFNLRKQKTKRFRKW